MSPDHPHVVSHALAHAASHAASHAALHAADARYARQRVLREFGVVGQERLAASRVLIVGAGGLGSPSALYLAAAGVGTIGLVDQDVVDPSNLHRQLLYDTRDVGREKLVAATERLRALNPLVTIVPHTTRLARANAETLVAEYHMVIDGTDNFPARYAINDACLARGIPFVYGSVARFEGQVSVFCAPDGPCYRCLFPEPPAPGMVPSCAEDGVLGVLPGVIGMMQSIEAIKWCVQLGTPLVGRLLLYDALMQRTEEVTLPKRPGCPHCGGGRRAGAASDDTRSTHREEQGMSEDIDPQSLAQSLKAGATPVLLDVREQWEYDIAHLPNATLVPLKTLQGAVGGLDPAKEYVVYCHHGGRSAMAAEWLRSQGFAKVSNLVGGIDQWSVQVDPGVRRY